MTALPSDNEPLWIPQADAFGKRLRWVRHELGMSVREVAEIIGIPQATLRTRENGAMPKKGSLSESELATRYQKHFRVNRLWLLYGDELSSFMKGPELTLIQGEGQERRHLRLLHLPPAGLPDRRRFPVAAVASGGVG